MLSNASSALNIGNGVLEFDDFAFTLGGGFGAGTYALFDTESTILGSLGTSLTGTLGGMNATISLTNGGKEIIMTVAAVPEPKTTALTVAGLGLLALAWRRRRLA